MIMRRWGKKMFRVAAGWKGRDDDKFSKDCCFPFLFSPPLSRRNKHLVSSLLCSIHSMAFRKLSSVNESMNRQLLFFCALTKNPYCYHNQIELNHILKVKNC